MLINKIADLKDMEAFADLPMEQINEILKDTPEYLIKILEKLARALFYHLNMPRKEAEEAVAKIRERKMGRLFENVTFDYQAEMEYMRNRSREMDERIKEMDERMDERIKEMEIAMEQKQQIMQQIYKMLLKKCSESEIEEFLIQKFSISREKAKEEIQKINGD